MTHTITTHADGFGNWHARVEFPEHGYGNAGEHALERHWDTIRRSARRAIRREIVQREQRRGETLAQTSARIRPVRVEVEAQGIYASSNVWYSVTFKESH